MLYAEFRKKFIEELKKYELKADEEEIAKYFIAQQIVWKWQIKDAKREHKKKRSGY